MPLDGKLIPKRNIAPLNEGVGYDMPRGRDPGHEHIQWFELDLDDLIDDPDEPMFDPLPTARHRSVPSNL